MKTILVILLLLLQSACNKNDDSFSPALPSATQTGENTFGCYVDGKLLIPRDGSGTFNAPDTGMSFSGFGNPPNYEYNEINVQDFKSGNGGIMDIHIVDLHENGEGNFIIAESNCESAVSGNPYTTINIRTRWFDEATQTYKWYCSIENGGMLNITRYDFENRIVSGTFNFTAINQDDSNDIIEITEGRFDIKWDELPSNFP